MLRTFLVAIRTAKAPAGFEEVIRRVSGLYRARLILAVVQNPEDPAVAALDLPAAPEQAGEAAAVAGEPAFRSVLLAGDFSTVVCDRGHEADVIVVWASGFTGPDGEPSTEELGKFIRQAPRPVWFVREPMRYPEHILVAYDGSAHSGRALHLGANLAEALGARLTVLHVDESRDEVAQELILSRAAGYCEPYRISMERVGITGSAAASIRDYAEQSQCDLVIVGAAGVSYLRGLLFGSVAGQVMTTASCSVLVAK